MTVEYNDQNDWTQSLLIEDEPLIGLHKEDLEP
jgi:hypothetical protein